MIRPPVDSAEQLVAEAVRELARLTRFPVAFGGLAEGAVVRVTTIVGNRTHSLDGLSVRAERGLGGRAMSELRPRMTHEYRTSQQFTHDYDVFVLGEGLRTLIALPIVVDGRSRGVLYAGAWEQSRIGDVTTAPAMGVVQRLADELRIREEVDRRVGEAVAARALAPPQREDLRQSFADLRSVAAEIEDPQLRRRLMAVEQRLLGLSAPEPSTATGAIGAVRLSPRETDVLACAALGLTNAQIGAQLSLREGTVKAYLGTAMSKLDAPTRHAAVARARRAGILP